MITAKAKELSNRAHAEFDHIVKAANVRNELMQELIHQCAPTLDEFMSLAGDLFYKPEDYYGMFWQTDKAGNIVRKISAWTQGDSSGG